MNINTNETVEFAGGDTLREVSSAKYLGCNLYATGDVGKEIGRIIGEAHRTWHKLGVFWKSAACSKKWKIIIYDAVIRAKLVYGLSTAALTQAQTKRIDAFQMRGLRQIMKKTHTFINRTNTNASILEAASRCRFDGEEGKIQKFSEYYLQQRQALFGHVLRCEAGDPLRQVTFVPRTATPPLPEKNRVGRPRLHWTLENMTQTWNEKLQHGGAYTVGRGDIEQEVLRAAIERKL